MNTIIAALDRTRRSIRRTAQHLIARLTRKASTKVTITVSLLPFLELSLDYKTDLGKPANDNQPRATARPRRKPRRTV